MIILTGEIKVTGGMKSYKESNDENNLEDFAEVQPQDSHILLKAQSMM